MSRQRKTQGAHDTHHSAKLWIAHRTERLLQALPVQIGGLGNLPHAACSRHDADRVPHEGSIAGFQRRGDVGRLSFLAVEIASRIEPRDLEHYSFSTNSRARLMSCRCVRLSPAHKRITIIAPRWT